MNPRAAWTLSPPSNFAASSRPRFYAAAILPCSLPLTLYRRSSCSPIASRLSTLDAFSLATHLPLSRAAPAPLLSKMLSCASLGTAHTRLTRPGRWPRHDPRLQRGRGFLLARPHHRSNLPHCLFVRGHPGALRRRHVLLRRAICGQPPAATRASRGRKLFC